MSEDAARKCGGKRRHSSKRKADSWARFTQQRTGVAMNGDACPYCKGWHVGRREPHVRPDREVPRSERYRPPDLTA